MDLVEIRKKAQKKRKAAAQAPENEPERAPQERSDAGDATEACVLSEDRSASAAEEKEAPASAFEPGQPRDDARADRLVAETGEEPGPTAVAEGFEQSDGLERLFSAQGEFALATEEAYLKALQADTEDEDTLRRRWLSFFIGREQYAVDIEQVKEIIKPREVTEVPRTPDFLPGIISLRGIIVPVIDLARRLRLGETQQSDRTRIIVCELGDRIAGLLVDTIAQVVDVSEHQVEPPPAVLTGLDRDMVEGVGRIQGRMVVLLNVEQVLDLEHVTA